MASRDCLHLSRKEAEAARWTFRSASPGYFRMGFVKPVFGQHQTLKLSIFTNDT